MKNILVIMLLFTASFSYAQFGSIIKKAKEKVTQPKNNPNNQNSENVNTENKNNSVLITKNSNSTAEIEFQRYDQNFGYNGSGGRNIKWLRNDYGQLDPYMPIRKVGEKGVFHFAKDYLELDSFTQKINPDINIIFSKKSFIGGNEILSNSFTSGENIYAKLVSRNGSIKEALNLSDDDDGILISFAVYDNDKNKIIENNSPIHYKISAQQAKSNAITIDILPELANYSNNKKGDIWTSAFANKQDQYTFAKNGSYKIGIFIKNEMVDDWGKPISGKTLVIANFFDYTFFAKDAEKIKADAAKLNDIRVQNIKTAIGPMPETWSLQSSPGMDGFTVAKYNQEYLKRVPNVKIIKTYISPGNGWGITKDNYNLLPIYKYSTQNATFFCKTSDGKCYYHTCGLRKNYEGGGTYSATFLAVFDNERYVDCEKMK